MNLIAADGPAAFALVFADPGLPISRKTSGSSTQNNNYSDRACEANNRLDRIWHLFRRRAHRGFLNLSDSFSETGGVSHKPANFFDIGAANLTLNWLRGFVVIHRQHWNRDADGGNPDHQMIKSSVMPRQCVDGMGDRRAEFIQWHSPVRPL